MLFDQAWISLKEWSLVWRKLFKEPLFGKQLQTQETKTIKSKEQVQETVFARFQIKAIKLVELNWTKHVSYWADKSEILEKKHKEMWDTIDHL